MAWRRSGALQQMETAMWEQFMTLVFLVPAAPLDGNAATTPMNAMGPTRIHMEVSGRPSSDCAAQVLTLPSPDSKGVLRFEDRGVRYEGTQAASGAILLRSNASRPLVLSGDRASGGRWSAGRDGKCVGVWKREI